MTTTLTSLILNAQTFVLQEPTKTMKKGLALNATLIVPTARDPTIISVNHVPSDTSIVLTQQHAIYHVQMDFISITTQVCVRHVLPNVRPVRILH